VPASGNDRAAFAATGTVMRPDTFRGYANQAEFKYVEVLDQIPHDFLRFYRLKA
jgi:hypothetical protein